MLRILDLGYHIGITGKFPHHQNPGGRAPGTGKRNPRPTGSSSKPMPPTSPPHPNGTNTAATNRHLSARFYSSWLKSAAKPRRPSPTPFGTTPCSLFGIDPETAPTRLTAISGPNIVGANGDAIDSPSRQGICLSARRGPVPGSFLQGFVIFPGQAAPACGAPCPASICSGRSCPRSEWHAEKPGHKSPCRWLWRSCGNPLPP